MVSLKLVAVIMMVAVLGASAQPAGLLGSLLGLIRINGVVYCTLDFNAGSSGSIASVIANGTVALRCGSNRTVVATVGTNSAGAFTFLLNPAEFLLSDLVGGCEVAIQTPTGSCNALGSGSLISPLTLIDQILWGTFKVFNLSPSAFTFNSF